MEYKGNILNMNKFLFLLIIIVYVVHSETMESKLLDKQRPSNLGNVDNNSQDLLSLKRQLELEKQKFELRKLKDSENSNTNVNEAKAQTVVIGVAINKGGKSFATLQFADGGILDVTLGSKVDKYTVSEINLNYVKLTYVVKRKNREYPHDFYLRRVYQGRTLKVASKNNTEKDSVYIPSPMLTPANEANDFAIPPIR